MNLYKQATISNWTFPSAKGNLTVSQLWSLPLETDRGITSLNAVAVELHNSLSSTAGVSFVKAASPADTLTSQKLELVKDIIATKEADAEEKQNAKAIASHNKMIDQMIEAKKTQQMGELTIEQLMASKK